MVDLNSLKNELQNIIGGEIEEGKSELIKAAQTYLRKSFATGAGIEKKEYNREEEEEKLKKFISDAIFYVYWEDYFNNLLIHNHLFSDTAYTLIGFYNSSNKLFAVLKQRFIQSTEITNLDSVKQFMLSNGFLQKKDNDYYHPFLGIIIEDLHDENVLTNNEVFFFTDTVIYITKEFYQ